MGAAMLPTGRAMEPMGARKRVLGSTDRARGTVIVPWALVASIPA